MLSSKEIGFGFWHGMVSVLSLFPVIELRPVRPIRRRPVKLPEARRREVEKMLESRLKNGEQLKPVYYVEADSER